MSLVMTARRSDEESSRHSRAMRELFPVPTGPQMPSRSARSGWVVSGTEQPPGGGGVVLGPCLDLWCSGSGDVAGRGEWCDRPGELLDGGQRGVRPAGHVVGIEGHQLERGG